MKKILIFVCCFLGYFVSAWASCIEDGPVQGSYQARDGQVFYRPAGKPHDQSDFVLVEGADAASIAHLDGKPPSTNKWYFSDYVLDKNHVYYQGRVLAGINPAQAAFLNQRFGQIALIDGLDQYVSREDMNKRDGYLKDAERVYYYGRLLEGANGADFEWLPFYQSVRHSDHDYARDDQHIYLYGQKVAGDAKTAHEIGYGYYSDAKHIYFRGEILQGALPDVFVIQGVFVISNGHIYYRAKQLALDADTFQVLKYINGIPISGCGATTYAGSFVMDRHGNYALHVTGELTRLNDAEATDSNSPTAYAYQEHVRSQSGRMSFYKDGHSIYFFKNVAQGSGNLETLFGGDTPTFDTYAALNRRVVFRDKTGFYLPGRYFGPALSKVVNGQARLVCLETEHLCLLTEDTLYYAFDNGTVEQVQVDAESLQCIPEDAVLPTSLIESAGMCFDRSYFYNRSERKPMHSGGYKEALPYALNATDLEEKRRESLNKVQVWRKPLLIEEKPEDGAFTRWVAA